MKKSILAISLACTFGFSATAAFAATSDWKPVTNDSSGLAYKIHVPAAFSKPVLDKRALMLVMTGCTQANTAVTDSASGSAANLETAAANWGMVMLSPAKNAATQAGFACWGYWEPAKVDASIKAVRTLVTNLVNDASLNIDPNQVYITGLSSGAAIAAEIGCGAPDLFAGVAPSAGPTMNTGSSCALNDKFCAISQSSFTQQCNGYATKFGADKKLFKTQIASVGYGTADKTVSTKYGLQNSELYAGFYKSHTGQTYTLSTNQALSGGKGGSERLWTAGDEKRVSLVAFNGVAHEWSAGAGATSKSYVSNVSLNYADYLGKFFTENNLRIPLVDSDVPNKLQCSTTKDSVNLTWEAPKSGADSYIVKSLTTGGNTETTATSSLFKPLTTGKTYTFAVAAKRAGKVYDDTKPIQCTPSAIAAPTDLKAEPTNNSVALSWKGVGAKYNITRNATLIGSPTATSHLDSGLSPVTDYNYCVTAVDQNGDESGATCVSAKTKPEQCWTTTAEASCTMHYVGKRLDVNQYLACGKANGYMKTIPLYGFGSPTQWANKSDCSAIAF